MSYIYSLYWLSSAVNDFGSGGDNIYICVSTAAMVMLLRDFVPYVIIFMILCLL
jgi:hypothetical protein